MFRMDSYTKGWTLKDIADAVGGELDGPADHIVSRPVPADSQDADGIAFAETGKYLEAALVSGVGALIVSHDSGSISKPCVRVAHPRAAFGRVLAMAQRPIPINEGIHPSAVVSPLATVDVSARIGPLVVVEAHSTIGAGCRLHAGCYVGENCHLAERVTLYPNVVLMQDVKIGPRCILHSNCTIGADGFGFVWDGSKQQKIPQVGGVILGADVEIGAGTCVDRATCGDTVVGDGTKLDNLIQFGHNSSIGVHGVIAGHVSVAGSVDIGDRVTIAGQAAIKDHTSVVSDVMLAGRVGAMKDITEPGAYFGFPAVPLREGMRQVAAIQALPELMKRVKALEAEVARQREENS